MTKRKTLIVLGILVVIVPFFGIPSPWKSWMLAIIGLLIVVFSILLRNRPSHKGTESETPAYAENGRAPEGQAEN